MAIQSKTGNVTGSSIKNQLSTDQLDIGSAFVWNARTAIIATVKKLLGHVMHPTFILVFLMLDIESFSIKILYSHRP